MDVPSFRPDVETGENRIKRNGQQIFEYEKIKRDECPVESADDECFEQHGGESGYGKQHPGIRELFYVETGGKAGGEKVQNQKSHNVDTERGCADNVGKNTQDECRNAVEGVRALANPKLNSGVKRSESQVIPKFRKTGNVKYQHHCHDA